MTHSALYEGTLRHRRYSPVEHRFTYPLFMAYLDLDELPELFDGRWLWSARRPALARFRRRDYLGDPAIPLAEAVRDLVRERTGVRPAGPIRLLTHLRYFGHGFNPVSFYYCFSPDGARVEAVVSEVTNTPWKERYCYVVSAYGGNGNGSVAGRVHELEKDFHVSPFFDLDQRYGWCFSEPGERLMVHMENFERPGVRPGEPGVTPPAGKRKQVAADGDDRLVKVFDATLDLARREITGRSLARVLVRYPFLTLAVVARIHLNAVRLWAKRVPFYDHPDKRTPPAPHRVLARAPVEPTAAEAQGAPSR